MDSETILQESQAEKLTAVLQLQTQSGKERFAAQLRLFSNQKESLERRQHAISAMRRVCQDPSIKEDLEATFSEIAALEPDLAIFFSQSEVEKNSYEQLTFSGWKWAQILNTIPFILLLLSYFKLYLVPCMALLTPLFMFALPYMALRYWYNLPITNEQYVHMMMSMFGLNPGEPLSPKTIVQGVITLFSIAQSIYQPIQNAIHLQTIHEDLVKRGAAVERLSLLFSKILSHIPFSKDILDRHTTLSEIATSLGDRHKNFADMWDAPFRLRIALYTIGDLEVLYRMACCPSLQKVRFVQRGGPCCLIQGGMDPFLPLEQCIPFNVRFVGEKQHAILTGPNRGGKSSVLRSTLLSVWMAQTFGFAFHTGKMILRPFDWIATGLKLEDRPGKASMFEREVEFAMSILKKAKSYPKQCGFVLFDELFHSTNPPDGAKTAHVFLEALWKQHNVASFISTHVFDLAHKAPTQIQKLCVPAYLKEDGSLQFTYTLKPGICEVSSVDEILEEKGLLVAREI